MFKYLFKFQYFSLNNNFSSILEMKKFKHRDLTIKVNSIK